MTTPISEGLQPTSPRGMKRPPEDVGSMQGRKVRPRHMTIPKAAAHIMEQLGTKEGTLSPEVAKESLRQFEDLCREGIDIDLTMELVHLLRDRHILTTKSATPLIVQAIAQNNLHLLASLISEDSHPTNPLKAYAKQHEKELKTMVETIGDASGLEHVARFLHELESVQPSRKRRRQEGLGQQVAIDRKMVPSLLRLSSCLRDITSVLSSNEDIQLKSRAFTIAQRTISSLVEQLGDPLGLQEDWQELVSSWNGTAACVQEGASQISAMLENITSQIEALGATPAEDDSVVNASIFQESGIRLQGLAANLDGINRANDAVKVRLFKAKEPMLATMVGKLAEYPELQYQLRGLLDKWSEKPSPEAFIQEIHSRLPTCLSLIRTETEALERMHQTTTAAKKTSDFSLFQEERVKQLLNESLSEEVRTDLTERPKTFQAANDLVAHILDGAYGDDIRELLLEGRINEHQFFFSSWSIASVIIKIFRQWRSFPRFRLMTPRRHDRHNQATKHSFRTYQKDHCQRRVPFSYVSHPMPPISISKTNLGSATCKSSLHCSTRPTSRIFCTLYSTQMSIC